jgi:hypothetical protein
MLHRVLSQIRVSTDSTAGGVGFLSFQAVSRRDVIRGVEMMRSPYKYEPLHSTVCRAEVL